jgi:hypothetical protein
MASPTYDSAFVDELIDDLEAYLQRATDLTTFAESQVEERVRLTRLVDELNADRERLHLRITTLERNPIVRVARVPLRVWRRVRHTVSR